MNHPDSTFDAIIAGARVAGSAVAIALARRGLRFLLVDKARVPSFRFARMLARHARAA
ncbi:MAG TPA: hypothetical protein VNF29_05305 [Candidatus Binataceae bacterium]|nr:hypothetical protein [Candidatus Binataceae bacterium]